MNLLLLRKGRTKEVKILLLRPLISTLISKYTSTLRFEQKGGIKKKVKKESGEKMGEDARECLLFTCTNSFNETGALSPFRPHLTQ